MHDNQCAVIDERYRAKTAKSYTFHEIPENHIVNLKRRYYLNMHRLCTTPKK